MSSDVCWPSQEGWSVAVRLLEKQPPVKARPEKGQHTLRCVLTGNKISLFCLLLNCLFIHHSVPFGKKAKCSFYFHAYFHLIISKIAFVFLGRRTKNSVSQMNSLSACLPLGFFPCVGKRRCLKELVVRGEELGAFRVGFPSVWMMSPVPGRCRPRWHS